MAPWKQSARAVPIKSGSASESTPRKAVALAALVLAVAFYWLLFLAQPVLEGNAGHDGETLSRGGFVLNALVYPDGLVASWFDGGRLPANFLDRVPLALSTLLWLTLAALIGWPLVSVAASTFDKSLTSSVIERLAWSALIGLAWLSTATLLVGLAGGLGTRWPLALTALLLLAISIAVTIMRRCASTHSSPASIEPMTSGPDAQHPQPRIAQPDDESNASHGLFDRALWLVTVLLTSWLAVAIMLGAWVPSSEFDVTEYHLQAPKEFFQAGTIGFVPHNIYANMPLGAEMHTLAAMTLIGESDTWMGGLIGKSITASLSLLGAALLGAYITRRSDTLAGWWAAGLWLACPGIAHVAVLGLIDGALAIYVLATVIATAQAVTATHHWLANTHVDDTYNFSRSRRVAMAWWTIASIMAGAATAIKYPGLIFAVAPIALVTVGARLWARSSNAARSRPSAATWERLAPLICCFVLGLLTTCVPWYAKNWAVTGNPVYPLAANVFGGRTLTPEKIQQWQRAHRVPAAAPAGAGLWQSLVANGQRLLADLLRLIVTSSYVQPAMIIGLAIFIGARPRHGPAWMQEGSTWLMWSLWIVVVWWLATHRIDRFWLPLTGLWAGISAIGLHWLRLRLSTWLPHVIAVLGLGYGAIINCSPLISDSRYFVALSALRDDAGDEQQVPRITREQAWINRHLENKTTRILLVGEARVFEYRVPILYSTCFDTNIGETLLRDRTPAEQLANLRAEGITHIMVNWQEIARYRSPGNYGFSSWPQRSDIQALIESDVVNRVDWGLPADASELLRVQ